MREFSTRIVVKLEEDEFEAAKNFEIDETLISPQPPPKLEQPSFDDLWTELSLACGKEKPVIRLNQRKTDPKGKGTMRNLTNAFHLAKTNGLFDSTRSETKRMGDRMSFRRTSKRRPRVSGDMDAPPLTPLLRLKAKSKSRPARQSSLGSASEPEKVRLLARSQTSKESVEDDGKSEPRTTGTTKPGTRQSFFGTLKLRMSSRRGTQFDLRDQMELPPQSPRLKPRSRDASLNEASFYKSTRSRHSARRNRSHGVFTLTRSDSIDSGFSKTHPLARRDGRRQSKVQSTNPRFKKKSMKEAEASMSSI